VADALDRYSTWCNSNAIAHERHGNWLHLPDDRLAVVVTLTPPVSRNATMAALARVTDPDLPVLIETTVLPYGELYASRSDGNRLLGRATWVYGANGDLHVARMPDTRPA
jgi:hypothetical protein